MISRKAKFLSAVVVALIATIAVARTVHTNHAVPAGPHASHGKVIGTAPSPTTTTPPAHGIIVCGMALDSDCEKLEMLLPM